MPSLVKAMEHHRAGRSSEAERLYRTALELAPHHGEILRLLGGLYVQAGKPEQAVPLLQETIQQQPKNLEILNNLGTALHDTGRSAEAAAYFRRALEINPDSAEIQNNLGIALQKDGLTDAALACFEKAASLKPHYVDALSNMAGMLSLAGRESEVRPTLEHAVRINPRHPGALTNLGLAIYEEGKPDESLDYFNRALKENPAYAEALWWKSYALLALGDYREGWRLFDVGLGNLRGPNRFAPVKPWDGKAATDKHLLIWHEQGLGDSLQFIRYAALCKQRVGKVSVLCPKPLIRLFKNLPYVDDAFDTPQAGQNFDEHVPMMSLPNLFETVLETVLTEIPYLRVDPEIQAKWAAKFSGVTGMKIGLAWAGGIREGFLAANRVDRQRSISLERMKPWLDLQGAKFYNLQLDKPREQIAALGLADRLTDFMGEVEDFADTASLVQNLDLVITVDTSIAHLAGGLGKPVWILSRYNACWRWLQNQRTNPWYPTARIFGQPAKGDWDSVMAEVERELTVILTI